MYDKILRTLSYFDIFSHPLNEKEIKNVAGLNQENDGLQTSLNELTLQKICFVKDGYYSIREDVNELVQTRKTKEAEAQKYFEKLPFFAKLIRSFPFVRGIAISGSLSKNIMYEDGDIDYFVITSADRLWVCRTFLILFKKVFLFNSKKYFCVNYFVDENNLEIVDKNIFTAVELTYLIPVYNQSIINDLKRANSWTSTYFPDFNHSIKLEVLEGGGIIKRKIEFLLKGSIGNRIDLLFMKLTFKRWNKKFKHFDADKFELTMRSNRGISKHHPQDFQNKVLKEYKSRLDKLNITL